MPASDDGDDAAPGAPDALPAVFYGLIPGRSRTLAETGDARTGDREQVTGYRGQPPIAVEEIGSRGPRSLAVTCPP